MKKILILTSSPQRDKLIDILLAEKLKAKGNEVFVRELPIGARQAILEIQPNVIVAPPIRQRYAYDLIETIGRLGIGVVLRHVEPSCDEQDLENMDEFWRKVLLLIRPAAVKLELLWSDTEVKYIRGHGIKTPLAVVGAFVADIYKDKKLSKKISTKKELLRKHQLSADKKLLIISSPWGFLDLAPDNKDKSSELCCKDAQAKAKWCAMVKNVAIGLKDWNILTTLHPRLDIESYRKSLPGIPIDTTATATELLVHCDTLIHAGSTMAMEMHWLGKPSFQFGDVNSLADGNWWQRRDSPISQISPYYLDIEKMITAIEDSQPQSNANIDAVRLLEQGRYGLMDGKATERAAKLINQIEGEFKLYWPDSRIDYDQLLFFKNANKIVSKIKCNICENIFFAVNKKWLEEVNKTYKTNIDYPDDKGCPHCIHNIARIVTVEQPMRKLTPKVKE